MFCKIETLRKKNDELAENMEMSTESWDKLIEQVKTLKVGLNCLFLYKIKLHLLVTCSSKYS